MTKRRILWLLVLVGVGAALAVLLPISPVYLGKFILADSRYYDNHTASYWIKTLKSKDAGERKQAAFALGAIGSDAGDAAPGVAQLMVEDADPEVRSAAALALSKMVPASRSVVAELSKALKDENLHVRMYAAQTLFRLQGEARPAVPALLKALEDETNQTNLSRFFMTIQEAVILALGRASSGEATAVPALIAILKGAPTEETRTVTARALGDIGTPAKPAVPALEKLLRDKNPDVHQAATEALRKITGEAGLSKDKSASLSKPDDLTLPEAERKYLWQIEHHGNLLVKYGFAPLAKALKTADAAALASLLSADFTGQDVQQPRTVAVRTTYADVKRLQDGGQPPARLNRNNFVARLLSFRQQFADRTPEAKIALMTLQPQRRGDLDGMWEGTAQLRMHGEHAAGAPAEVTLLLRYRVPRPSQETLSRTGWLHSAELVQALTCKAPHYLFAEVARQRGLDSSKLVDNWKSSQLNMVPGGIYVCDFDRDGILDVLVTDLNGNLLYRGLRHGKFEDVTARCSLPRSARDNTAAAWIDLDGDGWEDLILGGRIFRNDGGKRFVDYTNQCTLRLPEDAQNLIVADYDRDGRLDIYATRRGRPGTGSWLDGTSNEAKGNYLFRNTGNWQFVDVTRSSGAGGGRRSTFSAAWLDANNDGWPDLHVINEFGDGVLLVNKGDGTFAEQALADRPADFGSMGLAVGDVNNDGNIDIFCANMYSKAGTRVIGNLAPNAYPQPVMEKMRRFVAGSQLHLNQGNLRFEQVGQRMQVAAVGWSYGACLADLDNDGWLDIYATAGYLSRNREEPDG